MQYVDHHGISILLELVKLASFPDNSPFETAGNCVKGKSPALHFSGLEVTAGARLGLIISAVTDEGSAITTSVHSTSENDIYSNNQIFAGFSTYLILGEIRPPVDGPILPVKPTLLL